MTLKYMLFAEKVILDHGPLTPTAVGITDRVSLYLEDENGPVLDADALPIMGTVLTAWDKEPGDEATTIEYVLAIEFPDGKVTDLGSAEIQFGVHSRFFHRIGLQGINFGGNGNHRLLALKKGNSREVYGHWDMYLSLEPKPKDD